ncbi:hypothetical protein H634G_03630 [Metarhizium anisopliae BRIP 53293]|uniref:Methyltransferase domain-containing protein n=1 Tax=Metarhizium anisopliae BRIP 53293 TaxID=1291518 RepID=A0A0D9P4T8_METAN|nr:hypothetical protein H634G_03630 [Metarhizium anisopliae BRIP 53293]KJK95320.1 hypothetical protein H633G_00829 [Metarhizium anisopliae BRIP 53284]
MHNSFSPRDFILGIVVGFLIAVALISIGTFAFLRTSDIYSLGHWKLNLRTPLRSMWMNLGFWKTDDGKPIEHFDEATHTLLEQILEAAGLCAKDGSPIKSDSVAVLDLGFGCGDQTIALAKLIRAEKRSHFRYVGLTLDEAQLQTARRTVDRALAFGHDGEAVGLSQGSFKLFRANAAKPETWNRTIRSSVDALADEAFSERWLMALDCLYHFSPSRKPIFNLAAKALNARVMAFDLILDEEASSWNTILVRLVGLIMGCPLYTFLTEAQYREQLIECGYDREHIEIRDVSDHVFAGVSGYLKRQEAALGQYGISLGGYKLAGRLFEWFDRTRVVKAAIVVGRTKGTS